MYQDALEDEWRRENDPAYAAQMELREELAKARRGKREREQARQLFKELKAERRIELTTLFDRWAAVPGRKPRTVEGWRKHVADFARSLENPDANCVQHEHLISWRADLQRRGLSAKTINGAYMAAVRVVLTWARDEGLIDRNPPARVFRCRPVSTGSR